MSESTQQNENATRVDLGEDLLQHTAVLPGNTSHETVPPLPEKEPEWNQFSPSDSEAAPDQIESAKILMSEGWFEDAKRVLRHVLVKDSGNKIARDLLNQIHETELKQILGDQQVQHSYRKASSLDPHRKFTDSEELMRQLDQELDLGIFSPAVSKSSDGRLSQLSLFEDPELVDGFCKRLEQELDRDSIQDWIDLGVAFLEMELYKVAIRLFAGACRRCGNNFPTDSLTLVSATSLLALTFILNDRPFDAISQIQPLLKDLDLQHESKIELFYLLGRAYQILKKVDLAQQFYKQVIEIDPHYRDASERLRQL